MSTKPIPQSWRYRNNYEPWYTETYAEALAMQRKIGMIDLHLDCIIQQRLFGYDMMKRHAPTWPGMLFFWHADVPRMRDAGFRGATMGIHFPPWKSDKVWQELSIQMNYLQHVAETHPDAMLVTRPEDYETAREQGKFGMAPGIEGLHCINGSLELLEKFVKTYYVRYFTLCHFSKNDAATPSMGRNSNPDEPLTEFGKKCIRKMNELGVVVDVAHVNEAGTLDACETSERPVFCTHSVARGVFDHRRGLSDEALDAIAKTGGCVGVMAATVFLAGSRNVGSEAMVEHYDYIIKRIGIDHVCIGTDYDGWVPLPMDQRDCRDFVKVTKGLMDLGYGEDDLRKLFWENALRVMKASAV